MSTDKDSLSNKQLHNKTKYTCWLRKGNYKISDCDKIIETLVHMRPTLIKLHKLCFNCLLNDHMLSKCKSKISYDKWHRTVLHISKYMNENKDPKKQVENEGKNQNYHMHNHNSFGNKFALLQIIFAIFSNGIKDIETNALLESGSVLVKTQIK